MAQDTVPIVILPNPPDTSLAPFFEVVVHPTVLANAKPNSNFRHELVLLGLGCVEEKCNIGASTTALLRLERNYVLELGPILKPVTQKKQPDIHIPGMSNSAKTTEATDAADIKTTNGDQLTSSSLLDQLSHMAEGSIKNTRNSVSPAIIIPGLESCGPGPSSRLIEEISSSVTADTCDPSSNLNSAVYTITPDLLLGVLVISVYLPLVTSVTEVAMDVSAMDVLVSAPGVGETHIVLPSRIDDTVALRAKFSKKTRMLNVTLTVLPE